MAIPRPQYVFGTKSPYPTDKNVMAIIHMEFKILECLESRYLKENINKTLYYPTRLANLITCNNSPSYHKITTNDGSKLKKTKERDSCHAKVK